MRRLVLAVTALISVAYGSTSLACHNDGYYSLCPGDRVVSPDNYTGRVIGINPSRDTVVVDLDSFGSNYTYAIGDIYVTRGCVVNLCMGDRVVSPENYRGRVIGVNPYSRRVAVDLDSFGSHYSYDIDEVFSGFGCVDEICVGDDVVSPDNYPGRVIGINPYSGKVSVDLNSFGSHYSYDYSDIFLTTICVDYDTGYRHRARRRGIVRIGDYDTKLRPAREF
jgi:hypothetical protein